MITLITIGNLTFITRKGFSFDINWDDNNTKVGYIHQREYFPTLLKLIHKAKKNIVISIYLMDSTKRGDDPIVFKLVDSLVKAKNKRIEE